MIEVVLTQEVHVNAASDPVGLLLGDSGDVSLAAFQGRCVLTAACLANPLDGRPERYIRRRFEN
jgi:PIN domain nuclease of toxin-antitoxin system